jgi:hypothetical protein
MKTWSTTAIRLLLGLEDSGLCADSAERQQREQPVTGSLVCHVENSCIGRVCRIRSEK